MKLIALDVGTKRIGVAKADSKVRIAIPYSAVEVDGNEFQKIASLARAWDIDSFVIGLPRNSQGEETEQSRYVRQFARELKKVIPSAKICFQDESLTSVEAEKRLKNRKKGYKKGDIDSEAATIILQDFLEEKTGKSTTRAASAHRKSVKAAKPHRFATAIVTILVLVGLLGGAAFGYYQYNSRPVSEINCAEIDADECDDTVFAVLTGSSVSEVANELKEAGLIRDSLVFQVHFRLASRGESLKAGEYNLNKAMSVAEITELFLTGSRDNVFTFTFFPGENIFDFRKKLLLYGYTDEEIDAGLAADYSGKSYAWIFEGRPEDSTSLEGYLFGDTYEFYKGDAVENIVGRLIEEMANVVKENDLKAKFEAQGLNLYQGITLASVVQGEANNAVDQAKVARIFYNRINEGWTLGSDVTAKYAADLLDPNREVYTDNAAVLEIDSPYNTRKYAGLPYGPISNPSIDALNAVATPDESVADKYYFLTGDEGEMYYSSTEEEHNQNIQEYCKILCGVAL